MTAHIDAMLLGFVQGLTEFLPVSSSAHLILVPELIGLHDFGLPFDIAVHLGTLCAVLYFSRQWLAETTLGCLRRERTAWTRALQLGVATIPVGLAGILCYDWVAHGARSTNFLAITSIAFGLLLGVASRFSGKRSIENLRWLDVMVIALFQAVAILPGTSRSGITMTGGAFRGLSLEASARVSFLLAIPVIALAGGKGLWEWYHLPVSVAWHILFTGFLVSMMTALFVMRTFLQLLPRIGLWPFVLYRCLLGGYLLL